MFCSIDFSLLYRAIDDPEHTSYLIQKKCKIYRRQVIPRKHELVQRSERPACLSLQSLGGLRLGGGVGAEGAGGPEGVDVRLALDAVALVLLQAPPQRLHVARRRPRLLLCLVYPSTDGHRSRCRRRFHGGAVGSSPSLDRVWSLDAMGKGGFFFSFPAEPCASLLGGGGVIGKICLQSPNTRILEPQYASSLAELWLV